MPSSPVKANVADTAAPWVVYEPPRGWVALRLGELWDYRELLYFLAWRDIKIRYKQAALGVGWAILQPLLTMVIFSVIFGELAKLPSDGIPYPVFSFAALLPWQLFAGGLQRSVTSLVGNSNMLTKVYFPRLAIPISAVAAGLVDFALSFLVFAGLMFFYGIRLSWAIVILLPLVLLALMTALAASLWLSALNVQYRDVQQMIPFLLQAWMYASPVVYSTGLIPTGFWRIVYGLNPMAGVIQGFRWALLGTSAPDELMIVSVIAVFALLVSGLYYFRRMEKSFADVV
ncbi:MAG: ABC transporter permease [Anaerolineales bacterium]|jgi:lipopolysaccharide transport system permease protein